MSFFRKLGKFLFADQQFIPPTRSQSQSRKSGRNIKGSLMSQSEGSTSILRGSSGNKSQSIFFSDEQNKTVQVSIETLDNSIHQTTVISDLTILGLKNLIRTTMSDCLEPKRMQLTCQGTLLTNFQKISQIQAITKGPLRIKQNKVAIDQISNILADANRIDPISQEKGCAIMPCGHQIGTTSMTELFKNLINQKKYQIKCPFCSALWDFNICKKIGVFTLQQRTDFQEGLTRNAIKQMSKNCPKCKNPICKFGRESNRVVCPLCKYGDFCYKCLMPWNGTSSGNCGNSDCKFLNDYLAVCPWNKAFNLADKQTGKMNTYMTPKYRACPNCLATFQHKEACKHMKCSFCSTHFCWVCLYVNKTNNWGQCGVFDQYCGKVAPVQQL